MILNLSGHRSGHFFRECIVVLAASLSAFGLQRGFLSSGLGRAEGRHCPAPGPGKPGHLLLTGWAYYIGKELFSTVVSVLSQYTSACKFYSGMVSWRMLRNTCFDVVLSLRPLRVQGLAQNWRHVLFLGVSF